MTKHEAGYLEDSNGWAASRYGPGRPRELKEAIPTLPKAERNMKVLYQNTRSGRVRFLQIALWAWALGLPALLLPQVQAGSRDDAILVAVLTPILVVSALGMELYLRCYVVRLVELAEGLQIDTLSTFGHASRLVRWQDVNAGQDLHDRFIWGPAPSVDNTATLLRLAGRRLPLIIDTTKDAANLAKLPRWKRKQH